MLIPSGPTGYHLFIVIWAGEITARASGNQLLLASICTVYEGVPHDEACELEAGDHDFIDHESYVRYRDLRCDTPDHVDQMLNTGVWLAQPRASNSLLRRMRAGICSSRLVSKLFQHLLGC
jgi:hypothetical protein